MGSRVRSGWLGALSLRDTWIAGAENSPYPLHCLGEGVAQAGFSWAQPPAPWPRPVLAEARTPPPDPQNFMGSFSVLTGVSLSRVSS